VNCFTRIADQKDQSVALHIRRGVVEFVPEPSSYQKKADFVLESDGKTWSELYLNSNTLAEAIASGKVKVEGEQKEVVMLFDMLS
jgi:putative sterol carrier protein